MKIEDRKTSEIKPYEKNPRKNAGAVEAVARSIKEFGFRQPIVVDEQGVIIVGHTRWKAAQKLGLDTVPVHVAEGLSPAQIKAYRIADNKVAELAEWDLDLLPGELKELQDLNVDLSGLGFDPHELEHIMGSDYHGLTDPDDVPEVQAEVVSKLGDLWELGAHRLLCGDSTKKEDVERVMNGEKARLIVTSPPYNQGLDRFNPSGMHTETKWVKNVRSGSYEDSKPEEQYQHEQSEAIKTWAMSLTKDGSIFYNHKNRYRGKCVISPWGWINQAGAKVRQEIIWKREGSVTQNARMFMPCDERVFWLYFGDDFYFNDTTENKTHSSVWEINSHKDRGLSSHGCAFPVELALRPICACAEIGDVVLEPYCGSGTTLIAAEQLGRKCYAIEIEPRYVDVAVRRWQMHTGKKARNLTRPEIVIG